MCNWDLTVFIPDSSVFQKYLLSSSRKVTSVLIKYTEVNEETTGFIEAVRVLYMPWSELRQHVQEKRTSVDPVGITSTEVASKPQYYVKVPHDWSYKALAELLRH